MDTVQILWQRIEAWLDTHAFHAWQLLRPGASEREIHWAETAVGITFPEDFKASYRIHNGGYMMELVTEMTILSVEDIVAEWQMYKELEEVGTWSDAGIPYYFTEQIVRSGWQVGPVQPVWWHVRWIPFGRDRAGNVCCLDLAPASGGWVGQVIDRDHEVGPSRVLAPSFLEVLSSFASDLEAGAYRDTDTGLERLSKE